MSLQEGKRCVSQILNSFLYQVEAAVLYRPLRRVRCRLCLVNSYTPTLNYLQVFYTSVLPAHNQMFHVKVFNS